MTAGIRRMGKVMFSVCLSIRRGDGVPPRSLVSGPLCGYPWPLAPSPCFGGGGLLSLVLSLVLSQVLLECRGVVPPPPSQDRGYPVPRDRCAAGAVCLLRSRRRSFWFKKFTRVKKHILLQQYLLRIWKEVAHFFDRVTFQVEDISSGRFCQC